MFFFFSSTNTSERIDRLNVKLANIEIKVQLSILAHSSECRAKIAKQEIKNLMNNNNIDYVNGSGVIAQRENNIIKFIY